MRRRNSDDMVWTGLETAAETPRLMAAPTVYRGTPENDRFTGTAGADKWFAGVGGEDRFDGLSGMDTAVIDFSTVRAVPNSPTYHFFALNTRGYFQGGGEWSGGAAAFVNVESVNMTGTNDDDQFLVDAEPLNLGGFLKLDGAGGSDFLNIQFLGLSEDIRFVFRADGQVHGNMGGFYNFERFKVETGSGDDLIGGGAGNDVMIGSGGVDTVTYAEATAGVRVGLGLDTSQDTIGAGRDFVSSENLIGSSFADALTGDDRSNTLWGGRGGADRLAGGGADDLLMGENANDKLYGERGDDVLIGGKSGDLMTGGTGADVFRFESLGDFGPAARLDRITDFSAVQADRIDLSLIDPDPITGGDQSFAFIGTVAFSAGGSDYELRYESVDTGILLVQGDINHDGVMDLSFVVQASQLTAQDFDL